jgi:cytochrome P450
METAVEEILRWTTPSPSKRRTATTACKLGGARISPGQKVVVWEGSANRDPRRFDQPDTFLLQRDPNPHLAFGHGAHFCLDAHLARLEIRVALEEVRRRSGHAAIVTPASAISRCAYTRRPQHRDRPPACDVADADTDAIHRLDPSLLERA